MAQPMTHARIGYDSITRRGTVVASGETAGFPAVAAQNELTYSAWKVGVPATWEIQLASPETCNYFGLAAHNLGQNSIYASMQAFIDNEWRVLRVLNPGVLGDVFGYDSSFVGLRGTPVYGSTAASLRVGVAGDLRDVVGIAVLPHSGDPPVNATQRESKLGSHGVSIEPAATNLLTENVRTGTDSEEDTSGFTPDDGAATLTSDTEHFVSGDRSLKMVASGATGFSVSCGVDAGGTYTFQVKVLADEVGGSVSFYAYDGTTLFLSSALDYYTDNIGKWVHASYTVTVGESATTVSFGVSVNAATTLWCDEFQVTKGGSPMTWVNGTSVPGDLSYPPELVQQFSDCTVNLWVRGETPTEDAVLLSARSNDLLDYLRIAAKKCPGLDQDQLVDGTFETNNGWSFVGEFAGYHNTADARNGEFVARLHDGATATTSNALAVSEGEQFRFEAWARTFGNTAVATIRFLDSGNSEVATVSASVESPDDYARMRRDLVVPAGATKISVVLSQSGSAGDIAGQVYFDDVQLLGYVDAVAFDVAGDGGSEGVYIEEPLDGEWHMLTAVSNASSGISMYWDGALVASMDTGHLPSWQRISSFDVGHQAGSSITGPGLVLDDITIVGYAATAEQISSWYARTEPMDLEGSGLPPRADNRPIMRIVEDTKASRFRISLAGTGTAKIGVIYIGKSLEMQRPIYGGHTPISLSRKTVLRRNVTERGQWAGSTIVRSGASGSWTWNHLEAEWVRRYLDPFIDAVRTHPFFILWRPETFPNEAAYCWTLGDLAPTNMGLRDWMTFTLDAEGLGHE